MDASILVLCGTAASIGLIHTALGPDHYLPFIVMGRARNWSLVKTAAITIACGLGHVASSLLLGLLGFWLSLSVMRLETFEGLRGSVTAWLLIGFGLAYFIWGVHQAVRNRPHRHGWDINRHRHDDREAAHHARRVNRRELTPWILFTLFVLGPCEPLIPILMYPAAESSWWGMLLVATVFGVTTLATMLTIVVVMSWGVSLARLGSLERCMHAAAGATICMSGLSIQLLGL